MPHNCYHAPSLTQVFADDFLLFCPAHMQTLHHITEIFKKFESYSAQCINFQKSACLCAPSLSSSQFARFQQFLGMAVMDSRYKYLGAPL